MINLFPTPIKIVENKSFNNAELINHCEKLSKKVESGGKHWITKKVFNYVWDTLDLKNYKYSDSQKHIEDPHITSYYHFLTNQALKSLPDFHQDKFHKDDVPCAGIVYLSPNPPKNSGTAILDEKNNRFDIIENKYNRLLCYDGMLVHGPCNTFGIDKKTGRMTFTFFIHEIKLTGEFD